METLLSNFDVTSLNSPEAAGVPAQKGLAPFELALSYWWSGAKVGQSRAEFTAAAIIMCVAIVF
jgi:hypothetical protein